MGFAYIAYSDLIGGTLCGRWSEQVMEYSYVLPVLNGKSKRLNARKRSLNGSKTKRDLWLLPINDWLTIFGGPFFREALCNSTARTPSSTGLPPPPNPKIHSFLRRLRRGQPRRRRLRGASSPGSHREEGGRRGKEGDKFARILMHPFNGGRSYWAISYFWNGKTVFLLQEFTT
jgi:hypothetical protein